MNGVWVVTHAVATRARALPLNAEINRSHAPPPPIRLPLSAVEGDAMKRTHFNSRVLQTSLHICFIPVQTCMWYWSLTCLYQHASIFIPPPHDQMQRRPDSNIWTSPWFWSTLWISSLPYRRFSYSTTCYHLSHFERLLFMLGTGMPASLGSPAVYLTIYS